MKPLIPIRTALEHPDFFGCILGGPSWAAWRTLLIGAMGEELSSEEREVFAELTGRVCEPGARVDELWCVIGRRGGKTRAVASLGAYIAALCDWRDVLAPGEIATLPILSNTTEQSGKALEYLKGMFGAIPAFRQLVVGDNADSLTLSTRVRIEVRPANYRTVRGGTAVAIIADEVAFWRSDSSANPDSEIMDALKPALATTHGPLIAISSPFVRRGELWNAFRDHWGPDGDPRVIVARAASKRMNSELSDEFIARQIKRSPKKARAEYLCEWRDDLESVIGLEAVQAVVSPDVVEREPDHRFRYHAFVDAASGSGTDSMTLSIAHREGSLTISDCVMEFEPPFSPAAAIDAFMVTLRRYRVRRVSGDNYGGGFVAEKFRERGVGFNLITESKNAIYSAFVSALNERSVLLLDDEKSIAQLLALELRRSRATGAEKIDHGLNQHDDRINAVAGAAITAMRAKEALVNEGDYLEGGKPVELPKGLGGIVAVIAVADRGEHLGSAAVSFWFVSDLSGDLIQRNATLLDFDVGLASDAFLRLVYDRSRSLCDLCECGSFAGYSDRATYERYERLMAAEAMRIMDRRAQVGGALDRYAAMAGLPAIAAARVRDGRVKVSELATEKAVLHPLGDALDLRFSRQESPLEASLLLGVVSIFEQEPSRRAA